MFKTLIESAEFWLAIVALAQTILLNYLGVPSDIWQAVNAILLVMIGALTADRATMNISRTISRTILELRKMREEE